MSQPTLVEQLDSIDWDESSHELFAQLVSFSSSDEGAGVVLIAAAILLTRETSARNGNASFDDLADEFRELVIAVRDRLNDGRDRPVLTVVGGIDHTPNQKEA